MIRVFCDECGQEINLATHVRTVCSWGCGRDMCQRHALWDQHDQPACQLCSTTKLLKVRKSGMPRGSETWCSELPKS